MAYMNRKGFASVNTQGIADSDVKYHMLSINMAGSAQDYTAYSATEFSRKWKGTLKKYPGTQRYFYISNNGAYSCDANQVCKWPGTRLGHRFLYKDAFNFYLTAGNHDCCEHMWGHVYQRFGLLWHPIIYFL